MEEALSAEHFTYKFKTSTKPWHSLCHTNNEDSVITKILLHYVQDIVESSNDTMVQQITICCVKEQYLIFLAILSICMIYSVTYFMSTQQLMKSRTHAFSNIWICKITQKCTYKLFSWVYTLYLWMILFGVF